MFVATRVVTNRPGITGALTDGMFRWTALSGSFAMAKKFSAVSLNVSGRRAGGPDVDPPAPDVERVGRR